MASEAAATQLPTSSAWDWASRERLLADRLEELLTHILEETPQIVPSLELYVRAGKRLRGHLTLLPGVANPHADDEKIVRYAAAIELIHAGTLCHDDVVDRCVERRGGPSLNILAGNRAAAMGGLFLMWKAYDLVAGEPSIVRRVLAQASDTGSKRPATGDDRPVGLGSGRRFHRSTS